MSLQVEPITLQGNVVRLGPLQLHHAAELLEAGGDPRIWAYLPMNAPHTIAEMEEWIRQMLAMQEFGVELPFAISSLATGRVIGMTRYLNIVAHDCGLEIGGTWLTPEVWRTAVNTECKYLLLRHAFEAWGAIRVQFKTDSRNLRSQRAIERLGATKEGIFRNHVILPDGYRRHSVFYSILDTEWQQVKERLEAILHP